MRAGHLEELRETERRFVSRFEPAPFADDAGAGVMWENIHYRIRCDAHIAGLYVLNGFTHLVNMPDPAPSVFEAVRWALDKCRVEGTPEEMRSAVDGLARAVQDELLNLGMKVAEATPEDLGEQKDGVLWIDHLFSTVLQGYGATGDKLASLWIEKARQLSGMAQEYAPRPLPFPHTARVVKHGGGAVYATLEEGHQPTAPDLLSTQFDPSPEEDLQERGKVWSAWGEPHAQYSMVLSKNPPLFLNALARVVWQEVVRRRWEEEKQGKSRQLSAALPLGTRRHFVGYKEHRAVVTSDGFHILNEATGTIQHSFTLPRAVLVDPKRLRKAIGMVDRRTSVLAEKLLMRFLPIVVWERTNDMTVRNPNRLVFEGGAYAIQEEMNARGIPCNSKERAKILETLKAFRGTDDDRGFTWIAEVGDEKPGKGKKAKIEVLCGRLLAPGAHALWEENELKKLLAVPKYPDLSLWRNGTVLGRLLAWQWEIVEVMREDPEGYQAEGGAPLPALLEVRDVKGLSRELRIAALEHWSSGAGAWLRKTTSGRFQLEDGRGHSLLIEAASITEASRRGGRRSADKKRKLIKKV